MPDGVIFMLGALSGALIVLTVWAHVEALREEHPGVVHRMLECTDKPGWPRWLRTAALAWFMCLWEWWFARREAAVKAGSHRWPQEQACLLLRPHGVSQGGGTCV